MQSQGVLSIERMCQATGVSRAGFYRGWEEKAPDQAAMALRMPYSGRHWSIHDTVRRR